MAHIFSSPIVQSAASSLITFVQAAHAYAEARGRATIQREDLANALVAAVELKMLVPDGDGWRPVDDAKCHKKVGLGDCALAENMENEPTPEQPVGLVGLERETDQDQQEQPAEGGSDQHSDQPHASENPEIRSLILASLQQAAAREPDEAARDLADLFDDPPDSPPAPRQRKPVMRADRQRPEVRLPQGDGMRFSGRTNEHEACEVVRQLVRGASYALQDGMWRFCAQHRVDQGELEYAAWEVRRRMAQSVALGPVHCPVSYLKHIILVQRKARQQEFSTLWPTHWRGAGFVLERAA